MRTGLTLLFAVLAAACAPEGRRFEKADQGQAAFEPLVASCSGCHMAGGEAINGLEGLSEDALRSALVKYRSEPDGSSVMHRITRGFSDEDIETIAREISEVGGMRE